MQKSFLLFFIVLAVLSISAVFYFSQTEQMRFIKEMEEGSSTPVIEHTTKKRPVNSPDTIVVETQEPAPIDPATIPDPKSSASQLEPAEVCKGPEGIEMTFDEARAIALAGDCVKDGTLKENHFCNENSGTWWIDLAIDKEGCNPACVINTATKASEINWRCTGLISQ